MDYKPAVLISIGVAAGFMVAVLINRNGQWRAPAEDQLQALGDSSGEVAALRAESDRRIAALTSELEGMRRSAAAGSDAGDAHSAPRTREEIIRQMEDDHDKQRAFAKQRETEQLVAAGFSMSRIEWIRRRSDELRVKRQHEADERRQKGLKLDPLKSLTYMLDPDLDLREEMGDDEYSRYRKVLGRPDGVGIDRVLSSSDAERAGLKAGDQIVSYGGKRVFNLGMLDSLSNEGTLGEPVILEARREGRTVQIVMPRGRVGIYSRNRLTLPSDLNPDIVQR